MAKRVRKVSPLKPLGDFCPILTRKCLIPFLRQDRAYIALGLEGSANKFGAGVIKHDVDGSVTVLSNIRHTYITPPGEGFLPRDTAQHHRDWALKIIDDCLKKAEVSMHDLECICFTRGMSPVVSTCGRLKTELLQDPAWAHRCNLSC